MEIAKTILSQLGGNKFIVMTGAKNLVAHEDGLSFRIGRNKSQSNYIKITLTSMDLYNMEFWRIDARTGFKKLHSYDGIYFDMLQDLFTEYTGLYTSL